eukprot:TCALIF_14038-PA protein Name:"Protein of unknown function" AED:0.02 eAED:0.05 QI:4/0/0/1/0/0/2/0/257
MLLATTAGWDGTLVWSYTQDRAERFAFSDVVIEINDHVLSLEENKIVFDGVESLKPWRVGITIGYFYGKPFEELQASGYLRVQENQTDIDSIHKLLSKKVDAFLVSKPASEVIHMTNGNWPPYQSPNAHHFGVASHLVTEIFRVSDIGVQYDFLPDNSAFKLTKAGLYDATFLWAYSPTRQQDFEFSSPLILIKEVLLSTTKETKAITHYEQLKGRRIGVVLGFYYGEAFKKAKKDLGLHIQSAVTNEENLARLFAN